MPTYNGFRVNRSTDTIDVVVNSTTVMALQDDEIALKKAVTITGALSSSGVICQKGSQTDLTSNGAVTYTAAQILSGYILDTSHTGGVTATTDTAALIIAAMTAAGMPTTVGTSFDFIVINDGNQTVTMAGGTDVTLYGAALTMATTKASVWRVLVTGAATLAMLRLHDAA
jgi:hypothetical protein